MSEALRSPGVAWPGWEQRRRGMPAAARVTLVAGSAVSLVVVELVLRGDTSVRMQVAGQLVAFALFLPAVALSWNGLGIGMAGLTLVLAAAVLLRAVAFVPTAAPPLSTDLNRYVWDGRVQAAGINPYRFAPDDPRLADLRDAVIWPAINHPSWRTNYPPGAEASFALARALFGSGRRATTWLFLLAEGMALGLLLLVLRRLQAPPERVLVAAWHPLAISEIAANGHVDALALLAGAVLLVAVAYGRNALAGLAIAFAALVKLGPLLLLPALARRGRRFLLASLGLFVLGYAVYASAGTRVIGTTPRLLAREDIGSLAWFELTRVMDGTSAKFLLGSVLLAVVAVVSLRANDTVDQLARTCLIVLGGELLATNYLQPWYAVWLLPFLAVSVAPAWLWLTGTLPLIYLFAIDGRLPWLVRATIYGPFVVLSLARLRPRRRGRAVAVAPLGADTRVAAVIPALDEAESLPGLLAEFAPGVVDELIVVDGGSSDGTVEAARAGGARVVVEREHGYGRACRSGARSTEAEVVVFLDGDGSDDPTAIPRLVEPVLAGRAALVLGARKRRERGALRWHQRFGNRLVSVLVGVCYGVSVRDIPPMRAIRRDVLDGLGLVELTYGWPTEMVVKTARAGLPIVELPVPARTRRGGRSKVSGRLLPSVRAGLRMLAVVVRYA